MKTNHFKLADSSFSLYILCKKIKYPWIFLFLHKNKNSFFLNLNVPLFVYHLGLKKLFIIKALVAEQFRI